MEDEIYGILIGENNLLYVVNSRSCYNSAGNRHVFNVMCKVGVIHYFLPFEVTNFEQRAKKRAGYGTRWCQLSIEFCYVF
jgi:hypothetical protein